MNYNCDVLVAGGGIAGVSAALSAAREGKKVMLLEKSYMLGGLATAGLIAIYLPICDGKGRQVSFGIAEELLRLSAALCPKKTKGYTHWIENGGKNSDENSPRFEVDFNPQIAALLYERILLENKVEILYGAYAVGCKTEKNEIKSVIIESKSGREEIFATAFVDATGDFDIGHFASCPEKVTEKKNTVASWYYSVGKDGYNLEMLGFAEKPDEIFDIKATRFEGVSLKDHSDFIKVAHSQILSDVKEHLEEDETFEPVTLPTLPQFRMTRRISGKTEMSVKDDKKFVPSSVGMVSDWRYSGPVFEIPAEALYSEKFINLFAAGRCVSSTEEMWDVMRVIPCCAVTGEASGLMAAFYDKKEPDVEKIQKKLKERNIPLHESEL